MTRFVLEQYEDERLGNRMCKDYMIHQCPEVGKTGDLIFMATLFFLLGAAAVAVSK